MTLEAAFSPVERCLLGIRAYYEDGESGHHPRVLESVRLALTAAEVQARSQGMTLMALRAAIAKSASAATAVAARHAAYADHADAVGALPMCTYLAAWSDSTAHELRRVIRALDSELADL